MSNLFEFIPAETPASAIDVPVATPALARATSSLHETLTDQQKNVSLLRKYHQFQTAARNLLIDARRHGVDPLDGLHTAMQRMLTGQSRPRMRFSDLADYENEQDVVVKCRAITTDILTAIYPVSRTRDDASDLDALHRALEPKSIYSRLLREPTNRAGYRVHVSKLAGALAQLETIVAEEAVKSPQNTVPNAVFAIAADRLMSFRSHICEANMGEYIAVRYQPRELSDYRAESSWIVVRKVKVDGSHALTE